MSEPVKEKRGIPVVAGRCSKSVWDQFIRGATCKKKATVERGGKLFCTIHDPEYVAKKTAETRARWDFERRQRAARFDVELAESKLLASLENLAPDTFTEYPEVHAAFLKLIEAKKNLASVVGTGEGGV